MQQSNVAQSAAAGPSSIGDGMLVTKGSIDISLGSGVEGVLSIANMDSMSLIAMLNEGEGALGQELARVGEQIIDSKMTDHAKGDNLKLEQVGQGEKQAPPTIQGDLQMQAKGLFAGGGQQH